MAPEHPHSPDAWLERLGRTLADDPRVRERSRGVHLVIEQVVPAASGEVRWHVAVDDGDVRVGRGGAEAADVELHQDPDTVRAVQRGELSPQAAFMTGRLRVAGDAGRLLEHRELLEAMSAALAAAGPLAAPDPGDGDTRRGPPDA